MKFQRVLSTESDSHISNQIKWKTCNSKITNHKGDIIFEMNNIEVPESWSQNATNIIAQKYFRKAGVAQNFNKIYEIDIPKWLQRSEQAWNLDSDIGPETSAKQVFHRLAGAWTYWGWKEGIFRQNSNNSNPGIAEIQSEDMAEIFYEELYLILARQIAAPNSPQWFNTGLFWAYGIDGDDNGQWAVDKEGNPFETYNSYEYPQPHACFIQPIQDDLVNPGGIMDLWVREARLFKQGSGTGTNFSSIRGKNELLSGGGKSSGLMSFLKIGDVTAGSIASGGTTRRAAKMICLDLDHPEIEEFVEWKMKEEAKAAALYVGSILMKEKLEQVATSTHAKTSDDYSIDEARKFGIPEAMIDRAREGIIPDICDLGFEGKAMNTVDGQNANDSVRVTNKFFDAIDQDLDWNLTNRIDGKIYKTIKARDLLDKICGAAWASADPGLQFHDHINEWHTCKIDGNINASNPCSEYMFLDNTACNLASINLIKFKKPDGEFDTKTFTHVTRLITIVLEISVFMASFPSKEIARNSYLYRTLGLGYANLGAYLMQKGIPYDSDKGRNLAADITALMHAQSYHTSNEMAKELGPFERYEANKESMLDVLYKHNCAAVVGNSILFKEACILYNSINNYIGFRNAQVTLIAPTGTIALVMDCDTTGIEPDLSLIKYKALSGGGNMEFINESITPALKTLGYTIPQISSIQQHIKENGTIEGWLVNGQPMPEQHLQVFDCANRNGNGTRYLRPEAHILMMAAVQPHLSGAISKTCNMPNESTIDDVKRIYRMANELKLKAVAIYRDGSKLTQPLTTKRETKLDFVEPVIAYEQRLEEKRLIKTTGGPLLEDIKDVIINGTSRRRLPSHAKGYTQKSRIDGQSVYLHTSEYEDGSLGAVFLELSREGSTVRALTNCIGIAVSIGLQFGVPLQKFVDAFVHRKFEPAGIVQNHDSIKMCHSIMDFVFRDLAIHYLKQNEYANINIEEIEKFIIPEPTIILDKMQSKEINTGNICPNCQHSTLFQAGTCVECRTCGYNTGCG